MRLAIVFTMLLVPTILLAQAPAVDSLSCTLASGKVLHFQTTEQKEKYLAALNRQASQAIADPQSISKDNREAGWHLPNCPYPYQAKAAHLTGESTVRITTNASGHVSSVVILRSSGSGLLDNNTDTFVRSKWSGPPNSLLTKEVAYRIEKQ